MRKKLIVPLLILSGFLVCFNVSFAHAREPRKVLYLLGGGAEPDGPTTHYDPEIESLAAKTLGAGYETRLYFSLAHRDTVEILLESFGKNGGIGSGLQDFTPQTYRMLIQDLILQISQGSFQEGDQVLFVLMSHGSFPSTTLPEHTMACGRIDGCRISEVSDVLNRLTESKVKTAVIDLTCYSGASLRLETPGTCLLAAAPYDSIGLESDSAKIIDSLVNGVSLESSFLAMKPQAMGSPQIGTTAGRMTESLLSQLYERVRFAEMNVWTSVWQEDQNALAELRGSREFRIERFLGHLPAELRQILQGSSSWEDIKSALKEYDEFRKAALASFVRMEGLRSHSPRMANRLARELFDGLLSIEYSRWRGNFASPLGRAVIEIWEEENKIYSKIYQYFLAQQRPPLNSGPCTRFTF